MRVELLYAPGCPLAERLRDLPERFRELHRTALRAFLDGHRPDRDDLRRSAQELDVDRAFAMCAIDALGVGFMAGERVLVRSRDPIGGEPIEASIDAAGTHSWEPAAAVVIAATPGDGPNAATCCPNVNFLASRQRAQDIVGGPGAVLEMPEAIELGRRIFGSLLYDA